MRKTLANQRYNLQDILSVTTTTSSALVLRHLPTQKPLKESKVGERNTPSYNYALFMLLHAVMHHFLLIADFVIYVDGWTQSSVVVMKMSQDIVVECAHSIAPPATALILATGGVLKSNSNSTDSKDLAVVCGGVSVIDDSNSNEPNEKCIILSEMQLPATSTGQTLSAEGFLNNQRIGASSLVIDNGLTLWITAGSDAFSVLRDTEFVAFTKENSSSNGFTSMVVGPDVRTSVSHHCLGMVGPGLAILTGGTLQKDEQGK